MIVNKPITKVEKLEEKYSKQDGVPIKYVCTSELLSSGPLMDIFYRDTPHPVFGNRYFGVFHIGLREHWYITNADSVEELNFFMIKDKKGDYRYSDSNHDMVVIDGHFLDGGRYYPRDSGTDTTLYLFKVIDGEFKEIK